jgi:hypothetical protein
MHGFFKNRLPIREKSPVLLHQDPRVVGTMFDTCPTPDALLKINHHHAVIPLVGGMGRTNVHTRGFFAVVAQYRQEDPHHIRELAQFPFQHVGLENSRGSIVLRLASHDTGLATDTLSQIYNHSISWHRSIPPVL